MYATWQGPEKAWGPSFHWEGPAPTLRHRANIIWAIHLNEYFEDLEHNAPNFSRTPTQKKGQIRLRADFPCRN